MNIHQSDLIPSKRAWRSADFRSDADWVTRWTDAEIADLKSAATKLPDDPQSWLAVDCKALTTPLLEQKFKQASREMTNGRGFVLFRGLDASDPALLRRKFWIVGNRLGTPVMQNARGEVLSEVTDRFSGAERTADTRGYESNDELRFHCDGGDCISMACVRQAPKGGLNGIVSLLAIHNEIVKHHPEHLSVLQRGYPLYARKEKGDAASTAKLGKVSQQRIPVFATEQGYASAWLNILLSILAAEMSGIPMTQEEKAAMDCVEEIAERPDMKLSFMQQPGDMIFLNNLAVMHQRQKYEDHPDAAKKRLLFRMWLNFHDAPPVVPEHAAIRNGIRGPEPVIAWS